MTHWDTSRLLFFFFLTYSRLDDVKTSSRITICLWHSSCHLKFKKKTSNCVVLRAHCGRTYCVLFSQRGSNGFCIDCRCHDVCREDENGASWHRCQERARHWRRKRREISRLRPVTICRWLRLLPTNVRWVAYAISRYVDTHSPQLWLYEHLRGNCYQWTTRKVERRDILLLWKKSCRHPCVEICSIYSRSTDVYTVATGKRMPALEGFG